MQARLGYSVGMTWTVLLYKKDNGINETLTIKLGNHTWQEDVKWESVGNLLETADN